MKSQLSAPGPGPNEHRDPGAASIMTPTADLGPTVQLLTRDLAAARLERDLRSEECIRLRLAQEHAEHERDRAIAERDEARGELTRRDAARDHAQWLRRSGTRPSLRLVRGCE